MKPPHGSGADPTVRRQRLTRPEDTSATYQLSVLEGPDTGLGVTLDGSSPTRVLLGTSPVCTVRITDQEVSRRHAALAVCVDHVQIVDLGSTNGTTVNGVVIKEASLYGGEVIRIGRSVMSLQRGEERPANIGVTTSFGRIVGESIAMRRLYPVLEKLAGLERPVLLEGETGTGKELVAEELHRASKRADAAFIVLESSAIPTDQLVGHLFGTPEDPSRSEPGLVERAKGGVLFIDEIGDLPRHAQKRLRDLITSGTDVRLIAATRHDLDKNVTAGRFDEALFFELASGRVELPPLRDRQGDVTVLAKHFWTELAMSTPNTATGKSPELPIDLLPRFEQYPWPGNVRELRSVVVQRATFGELSKTYLSDKARDQGLDFMSAVIQDDLPFPTARDRVVTEFERRYVERVLARHGGNVTAAARASGVAHRYFQLVRARVR
jgi:DNA-binding NtrC family response regulator